MTTIFNLLITKEAAEDIQQINQYLIENWSERVRDNFIKKLKNSVATIQRMPYAFPISEQKPDLRKCVISPQVSLYYILKENSVIIVSVLSNRLG
jgi:plasmid stabilization system protein ParE